MMPLKEETMKMIACLLCVATLVAGCTTAPEVGKSTLRCNLEISDALRTMREQTRGSDHEYARARLAILESRFPELRGGPGERGLIEEQIRACNW